MLPEGFNVVIWYADDGYEYVRRNVSAEDAVTAARHYCSSPAAEIGLTKRVIITDGDDSTNFDWRYGEGVVFPKREDLARC